MKTYDAIGYEPAQIDQNIPQSIEEAELDPTFQAAAEIYVNGIKRSSGFLDAFSLSERFERDAKTGRYDITEILRDEDWRLETILDRNLNSSNLTDYEKQAYQYIRTVFDELQIKGGKERAQQIKDIGTDIIFSPTTLVSLLLGGPGTTQASRAGMNALARFALSDTAKEAATKATIFGAATGFSEDLAQQGYQKSTGVRENIDYGRLFGATTLGGIIDGGISTLASNVSKLSKNRFDNDQDPKTMRDRSEDDTAGENSEVNAVIDEEVNKVISTGEGKQLDLPLLTEEDIEMYNSRPSRNQPNQTDVLQFKMRFLRGLEARLLGDTGEKITRRERIALNKELESLKLERKNIVVEPADVEPIKGESKRRQKVRAKRLGEEQVAERRTDLDLKIQNLENKLERDAIGTLAESDLSRLEQLIVPDQFKDEYLEAFEKQFPKKKTYVPSKINVNAEETAEKISKEAGGGTQTIEEVQDTIEETIADLPPNTPPSTASGKLKYNINRILNRYGSRIIFKPVSVIQSFANDSKTAANLLTRFRYDANRNIWEQRDYDKQDFFEIYKETAGTHYVRAKVAMEPIAINMRGELNDLANNQVLKVLRGGEVDNENINKIAFELRDVLTEIGTNLKKAGFITGEIENYFPRAWNRKAIERSKDPFAEKLLSSGEATNIEEANRIVADMLDKKNHLGQGSGAGSTFFYTRKFDKLKDNDFEEFLDNDVVSVMNNYIFTTSKQLAKKKAFNVRKQSEFQSRWIDPIRRELRAKGKTLTKRDEADLIRVYQSTTGEGVDRYSSSTFQGIVDGYGIANRMAYLPLATLSSLTEIFINIAKAGPVKSLRGFVGASDAARKTITDDLSEKLGKQGLTEQEIWKEMNKFGLALDMSLVDVAERLSGDQIQSKLGQKITNKFFRVTFLDQWTKFVQMSSYLTGKNLITENLEAIALHRKKDLAPSSRIKRLETELKELNVNIDQGIKWLEGGLNTKDSFYTDIQRGAARYTNEVILNPSPESGLKPTLMSNPQTSILFQFMGYPTAFTNTILKNAGKNLLKGIVRLDFENTARTVAAGAIMTEMARWSNYARSGGESEKYKDPLEIYSRAIVRWGGNGIVADMMMRANKAAEIYQDPLASVTGFMGPVGQDAYTLIRRGDAVSFFGKKVPFYGAFKTVEDAFDVEFVDKYNNALKEGDKLFEETFVPERSPEPRSGLFEGGLAILRDTDEKVTNVSNVIANPEERLVENTDRTFEEIAEDPLRQMFSKGGAAKEIIKAGKDFFGFYNPVEKAVLNIEAGKKLQGNAFYKEIQRQTILADSPAGQPVSDDIMAQAGLKDLKGNEKSITIEEIQEVLAQQRLNTPLVRSQLKTDEVDYDHANIAEEQLKIAEAREKDNLRVFEDIYDIQADEYVLEFLLKNDPELYAEIQTGRITNEEFLALGPEKLDSLHRKFIEEQKTLVEKALGMDGRFTAYTLAGEQGEMPTNYKEILFEADTNQTVFPYINKKHYPDRKNVISFIRTSDIQDKELGKIKMLEESQTDAHVNGSKFGYTTYNTKTDFKLDSFPSKKDKKVWKNIETYIQEIVTHYQANKEILKYAERDLERFYAKHGTDLGKLYRNESEEYQQIITDINKAKTDIQIVETNEELKNQIDAFYGNPTSLAVPIDLPFKKSWPELNLKGFLMDAANDDADTLGLPTYKIIAQRYEQEDSPIEAISRIYDEKNIQWLNNWARQNDYRDVNGELIQVEKVNLKIEDKKSPKSEEELDKIYDDRMQQSIEEFEEESLENWMNQYENEMFREERGIPRDIETETFDLIPDDDYDDIIYMEGREIYAMTLTREMKEDIKKGLPMFSEGGLVINDDI